LSVVEGIATAVIALIALFSAVVAMVSSHTLLQSRISFMGKTESEFRKELQEARDDLKASTDAVKSLELVVKVQLTEHKVMINLMNKTLESLVERVEEVETMIERLKASLKLQ
jgi:hypothetical protein